VFEAMLDAGLFTLTMPARFGGPDEPIGMLAAVVEELRGAFLLSTPLPDGPPEPEPDDWLTRVRELEPIVAQYRDESERERRLSAPVFEAMRERRLLSMMVSKAFGGSDVGGARCRAVVAVRRRRGLEPGHRRRRCADGRLPAGGARAGDVRQLGQRRVVQW
jgi:alkylation response protein AidB-like acyl-CoA dehydrogenase